MPNRVTQISVEVLQTVGQTYNELRSTAVAVEVLETVAQIQDTPLRVSQLMVEILETGRSALTAPVFEVTVKDNVFFKEYFFAQDHVLFSEDRIETSDNFFVENIVLFEESALTLTDDFIVGTQSASLTTGGEETIVFEYTVVESDIVSFEETAFVYEDVFELVPDFDVIFSETITINDFKATALLEDSVVFGDLNLSPIQYKDGTGGGTKRVDQDGGTYTHQSTVVFGGTLTLRTPEFNDIHRNVSHSEQRSTFGGVYENVDESYPDYERFEMVFRGLTRTEAFATKTFVEANLGQPVSFVNYDGRSLTVVFVEPELNIRQQGIECNYSIELKFEVA